MLLMADMSFGVTLLTIQNDDNLSPTTKIRKPSPRNPTKDELKNIAKHLESFDVSKYGFYLESFSDGVSKYGFYENIEKDYQKVLVDPSLWSLESGNFHEGVALVWINAELRVDQKLMPEQRIFSFAAFINKAKERSATMGEWLLNDE
jgi:hypothetical protein